MTLLAALVASSSAVEFVVTVPEQTPADALVYVSGSVPELGNWKADGRQLARAEDGTFRAEIPLEVGQNVEFKCTLGTWETVEKNADGSERDNRVLNVEKQSMKLEAKVERWASAEQMAESSVVGTIKLHTIQSNALGKQRTLRVWLPADYESNLDRRYPVLYMHDGQNCFDKRTSAFGNEWQIDETLTKLIDEKKVPPMIVVGIDNGGADRISEYTFVADPKHGGGNGERYAAFLLNEVRPLIDRTYRTQVGRESCFIGGSSLGGLVSLEIARRHPDVFGGVIAMSPSLHWSGMSIVTELERDSSRLANTRVWIDMGTSEGDAADAFLNVDLTKRVDAALKDQKIEHHATIAEGAEHNEAAWAKRFPDAIVYLTNPAIEK